MWLNAWGCRQFAKAYHAVASDSLANWSKTWLARLPGPDVHLTDLSPAQVVPCAAAYDALRVCRASLKQRAGRAFPVTYGPTGAAKTLFALRPNVFPPWDNAIRKARDWGPDAASFQAYLTDTADQLRRLSAEAGVGLGLRLDDGRAPVHLFAPDRTRNAESAGPSPSVTTEADQRSLRRCRGAQPTVS